MHKVFYALLCLVPCYLICPRASVLRFPLSITSALYQAAPPPTLHHSSMEPWRCLPSKE